MIFQAHENKTQQQQQQQKQNKARYKEQNVQYFKHYKVQFESREYRRRMGNMTVQKYVRTKRKKKSRHPQNRTMDDVKRIMHIYSSKGDNQQ